MKKYVIQFMCIDMPSMEEHDIDGGVNFGVHKQAFNSKEDAQKYLKEVMIPDDKANLEYWYGLNDKDFDPPVELSVEDISYERKELVVYDKHDRSEVSITMYEIVEIEVE